MLEYAPCVASVCVAFGHFEAVVVGQLLYELWRHSGFEHLGDTGVLEAVEGVTVGETYGCAQVLPCAANVAAVFQHSAWPVAFGK